MVRSSDLLIQAWRKKEKLDKEWVDIWDNGHYVVVIGVDAKYIYFEDPSTLGGIGYILIRNVWI
jgi:predicted double-glycine peptidase